MALKLAAEIERDFISSRTKEVLKARKTKGVRLGRPKGSGRSRLDCNGEEITVLSKARVGKRFIAQKFNVTLKKCWIF